MNGTQNVMMAAVLAEGRTVIENAAREPEVAELAEVLIAMGAQVHGAGTDASRSTACERLARRRSSRSAGDRIEVGTLLAAG